MKIHGHFTLFYRTVPSGKRVVYYLAYNEKGARVGPWSTGETTKTAARNKCEDLYREGRLIPDKTKAKTFGEFAEGFWARGSAYVKNQEGRADITDCYIDNCRKMTANQILPFFGNMPLDKISSRDINNWLLGFKCRTVVNNGKTEIKAYRNTYANTVLGTLNVMLSFAAEQELVKDNPCAKVRRLKNDRKEIKILTVAEVRKIFPKNYKAVWGGGRFAAYAANRLASLTGMRAGEIRGLRGEYVFDNYIYVCGSFGEYGYGPTKTKETRFIPLIPEMIGLLKTLMKENGKGYVFSLDGGGTPVSRKYFYDEFHRALMRIGMPKAEIKRRNLTLHSWRHFLNTELQRQGLTLQQVQAVTGHKSVQMTERYSHWDARQLSGVMEAQMQIAGGAKAKGAKMKIVQMPDKKNTVSRKRA